MFILIFLLASEMRCSGCFVPSVDVYKQYYAQQIGSGGITVYRSSKNYRGTGFGGILKAIGSVASPFLKKIGRVALQEGLKTGKEIVDHVASGSNLKTAFKKGVTSGGKRFLNNAIGEVVGGSSDAKKRKSSQLARVAATAAKKTKLVRSRRKKKKATIFD